MRGSLFAFQATQPFPRSATNQISTLAKLQQKVTKFE